MKRIGIDVGGTNTDAVLIDGETVLSAIKFPTTSDVMKGVVDAIRHVTTSQPANASPIDAVMIGTTHFTNAVVERARLERVGAIRIAMPAGASLPPMVDWPDDLREAVDPLSFMVEGGHEYDGRPLVPLDRDAVRDAAMR
ncbi:MAG: hydantoinase/oxoprolinase N-terminal domain-containing protein, partial [Aliihoeflea sp.]